MWPGVSEVDSLQDIRIDDVIGIRSADGTFVGVGALAMNLDEVKALDKPEGVAAYLLHYEGDKLWEAGSKTHASALFDKDAEAAFLEKAQRKAEKKDKKKKKKRKKDDGSSDEEEDMIGAFANFGKANVVKNDEDDFRDEIAYQK